MSTLGGNIKRLRERHNISQKDFAQKIGVSNVVLSRYESDERKPDYDTLQKIADFFETSLDQLLGRGASDTWKSTDSLGEIKKLAENAGIDSSGFFDLEQWRSLSPDEMAQVIKYFEFIQMQSKSKQ